MPGGLIQGSRGGYPGGIQRNAKGQHIGLQLLVTLEHTHKVHTCHAGPQHRLCHFQTVGVGGNAHPLLVIQPVAVHRLDCTCDLCQAAVATGEIVGFVVLQINRRTLRHRKRPHALKAVKIDMHILGNGVGFSVFPLEDKELIRTLALLDTLLNRIHIAFKAVRSKNRGRLGSAQDNVAIHQVGYKAIACEIEIGHAEFRLHTVADVHVVLGTVDVQLHLTGELALHRQDIRHRRLGAIRPQAQLGDLWVIGKERAATAENAVGVGHLRLAAGDAAAIHIQLCATIYIHIAAGPAADAVADLAAVHIECTPYQHHAAVFHGLALGQAVGQRAAVEVQGRPVSTNTVPPPKLSSA